MPSPDPATEARRRALLSLIAQKRGYYAPPQMASTLPPAAEPEPSGFTKALRTVGKVAGPIFQGSKFADLVLPGDPGTELKGKVSSIPYVGKPLAEGLDAFISPFSIATLGYGGIAATGLRSAGAMGATRGFSRFAAPLVEPLVAGSLKTRIGAELAANLGGQGGMELAERAGLPEPIQLAAGLLGGAAGVRTVANAAARTKLTRGGLSPEEVEVKLATGDATDKFVALASKAQVESLKQATERSAEFGRRMGIAKTGLTGSMSLDEMGRTVAIAEKGKMPSRTFGTPVTGVEGPLSVSGKSINIVTGKPYEGIPEDHVRLFRGETPGGTLSGVSEANPAGIPGNQGLWSPSHAFANRFAKDGNVFSIDVPKADADAWQLRTAENGLPADYAPNSFDEIRNAQVRGADPAVMGYIEPPKDLIRGVHGGGIDIAGVRLEPSDIDAMKERVKNYFFTAEKIPELRRASDAMTKLFAGEIPQDNEIRLLAEALGTDFGMVMTKLSQNPSLWRTAIEVAGVPRAIMSSFDASMPFRQGLLGMSRKEWRQAWKPMIKSFHDGKYADAVAEDIATSTHPMVGLLRDTKVISATPEKMQSLEEGFTSGIAEIFPWVRQSERGALTFVNKFRADYAKNIYDGWKRTGYDAGAIASMRRMNTAKLSGEALSVATKHNAEIDLAKKNMEQLAKWTGIISGRGALPKFDGSREAISLMNSLFFSPKFLFSRLQAVDPRTYMQMTPLVRKEAMRDMVSSLGPAIGAVTMLGMAGKAGILPGVSVEIDPRSSDFGKVRLGQQRLDPFGGFQPLARYMVQAATGQAKSSTGEIKDRPFVESVMNFGRGKLAPIPGFLVDALTGKDFTGQEVDVVTGGGLDRAAAERLTPLFAQDLADAYRAEGYGGIAYALPAAFGFSVQSYNSAAAIQQAGAKEMYGKNWKDLTGVEQANVKAAKAEDLAKQSKPADDSVTALVDKVNTDTRAAEQELLDGLSTMGNKRFTDSMNDLMAARVNQIKGVVMASGLENGEDPTLLDRFFSLRNLATADGITDYEKLDELQADFIRNLPQDQQRIITERTRFEHVPGAKWWGDAKKTISESDYYRLKGQTLDKLAPLVQKLAPGVTTYEELLAARSQAQETGDVRQALILQNLVKRVDQITKQTQKVYRLKHREVDEALTLLYGSTPIRTQLAR